MLDKHLIININDEQDPIHVILGGKKMLGLVELKFGEKTLMAFLLFLSGIMPKETRFVPL